MRQLIIGEAFNIENTFFSNFEGIIGVRQLLKWGYLSWKPGTMPISNQLGGLYDSLLEWAMYIWSMDGTCQTPTYF